MTDIVLPDIPRFYTAFAEWSACLVFIILLKKRFSNWKTAGIAAIALVIQSVFLITTDDLQIYFWVPCMVMAVVMIIGFIYASCEISLIDAAYFGMQAFVTAEFSASFEWQVVCFFWYGKKMPSIWINILILVIVYGVINIFMGSILVSHLPKDGRMNITKKEYLSALVIGVAVFAVSNLSFLTVSTPFSGAYSAYIANIRTLVDVGGVAMLFAHFVQCSEIRVRQELESVQSVLQNQYVQYKQSRESIDLINYKYHDLKHQINVLRSETDPEKREAFLNRMEEEIKQYEAQNKTGNKVLDTVLTSKSLYCAKHGITFTCVADGTLLDFMDVMDICSIFGNALDNAIECECKIADKEKRLIHTTVSKQKNFLILRFENYFEGELNMEKGKPLTTKKDRDFHGYGIKSIYYTVDKYDGAISIETENSWFELKILIPIKNADSVEE